jgi:hypothetical protein
MKLEPADDGGSSWDPRPAPFWKICLVRWITRSRMKLARHMRELLGEAPSAGTVRASASVSGFPWMQANNVQKKWVQGDEAFLLFNL